MPIEKYDRQLFYLQGRHVYYPAPLFPPPGASPRWISQSPPRPFRPLGFAFQKRNHMEREPSGPARKWPIVLAAVLELSACVCCSNASAHVITSSRDACHWLRTNALPASPTNRQIFARARRLSGRNVDIYVDRAQVIARVAHIPDAPYLTAIVGRRDQCVAVSPVWLEPLTASERLWLSLVGIGGLQHRRTYKMMLRAAENPPSGLFSGLARWWGRRTADHAILASEKQATRWLPAHYQNSANAALVQLWRLPTFAKDRWLPKFSAQRRAVRQG